MVTILSLTNTPLPSSQVKYRFPPTLPSFLPVCESSSTPTHFPAANEVGPTNFTVPGPDEVCTRAESGITILIAV